MRRVIVSTIVSLDGYHEGPGTDVLVLPFDEGFSTYNLGRLRAAGTLLLGRTSFEGFRDYWPGVVDDETQDAVEREISRRNNEIEKVVVSDSLDPGETAPWDTTTRIVARADGPAAAAELRAGDGGDVLVFGSATLWNHLLVAGLVERRSLTTSQGPRAPRRGDRLCEAARNPAKWRPYRQPSSGATCFSTPSITCAL